MGGPTQSSPNPPLRGLLRAAGLLVRNRMDRLILAEALEGLGFVSHDLSEVDPGRGTWGAVDLLLVDETSAPAFTRVVAEAKRRVEPAFLPALVVVPRLGSAERWLRAGFDDVVRLPIPREELKGRLRVHLRLRERTLDAERAVFDRLPMGLFRANGEGEILAANAAMADLLGFPDPAALAAAGPVFEGLGLPDTLKAVQEALRGDGSVRGLELPWVRSDGTLVWIRWTGQIHGDPSGRVLLVEGAAEDVTLRRRIEQELHESRALNASTVDSLGANLAILSADGEILSVNAAWREFAARGGMDPALRAAVGMNYLEVCRRVDDGPSGEASRAARGIEEVLRGKVDLFELEYRMDVPGENGASLACWYRMRATPLRNEGDGPRGAVLTHLDVTRERAAQESLRAREAELRQAQKMEAVGRLAGGIAHDFNNLLTAIRGNVTLLRDRIAEGDPLRDEVGEIEESAERAASLTRQLLVLSRSQLSESRAVDVGELVCRTRQLLRRVIRADIELVAPKAESPLVVAADPANLEMVLLNLAVNARDAMPGGGSLTIRVLRGGPDPSTPGGRPGGGAHVVLEVEDTGEGIPEEIRPRIFEPFFTTREGAGGSGLGLSIVHGIVQEMGGTIEVESIPGTGTLFRIRLPLLEESPNGNAATPPRDEEDLRREGDNDPPRAREGETILLVEDDPQVRRPTRRILNRLGYRVVEAADGKEGLALLLDGSPGPDLVLSDVVMPRMTGPEMVRRYLEARGTEGHPTEPPGVLFVSGYTEREVDFFRSRTGTTAPRLLPKPFDVATLARVIRETLDAAGRAPEPPNRPTPAPRPRMSSAARR
jgi:two-component system, cell cycle sensor histidine kinase and response regulator CckA